MFNEDLRAEAVAALACVDFVAINKWPTAVETIKLLRPRFYVKGSEFEDKDDYIDGMALEREAITSVGGQLILTDEITFSSSNIINQQSLPKETIGYLAGFSSRYTVDDVLQYLEGAKPLKVLVIGESIIDEYVYCEALGKSSKEPILAWKYLREEAFQGGVDAIVAHLRSFCDIVNATMCPPIIKRRFIDEYSFTKLVETYNMGKHDISRWFLASGYNLLEEQVSNHDIVVVADYGHGMLTKKAIDIISNNACLLAVNVQANAGNLGYSTISKYPRADYISLAENEVRLEARDINGSLKDIVEDISQRLRCNKIAVTRGKNGCFTYDGGFYEIPAVATKVVDRMGAGDAFLAITALCVAQGAPMEIVGFIGNAVGAMQVATVGHRKPIEKVPLFRYVETLLK